MVGSSTLLVFKKTEMIKAFHGKIQYCQKCGKKLDAFTPTFVSSREPKTGDFSVCMYCGVILRINDNLDLIPATPDELVDFYIKSEESYFRALKASSMVKSPYWQNKIKNTKK